MQKKILANTDKILINDGNDANFSDQEITDIASTIADDSINYKDLNATNLYLKTIRRTKLLTKKEEQRYAHLVKKGNAIAKNCLIESNLRLVIKIARRYIKSGVAFLDLVSEGNIGLMKAVEKFDPNLNFRFSTYAAWWIQQSIERSIMCQKRTIRLPIHIAKKLNTFIKMVKDSGNQMPSKNFIPTVAAKMRTTPKEVKNLQLLNEHTLSMDLEIYHDNNKTLTDLVGSYKYNALYNLQQQRILEAVNELLKRLPFIQREVISKRFGLYTNDELTLEETGAEMGITREKVRNLQKNALEIVQEYVKQQGLKLDHFI